MQILWSQTLFREQSEDLWFWHRIETIQLQKYCTYRRTLVCEASITDAAAIWALNTITRRGNRFNLISYNIVMMIFFAVTVLFGETESASPSRTSGSRPVRFPRSAASGSCTCGRSRGRGGRLGWGQSEAS
jgi:hypothetical protein